MSEIKILESTVVLEIPRGRELVRLERVRAEVGSKGQLTIWHSLRVWFPGPDGWLPGKAGITIRSSELAAVAAALTTAASDADQR